MLFQPRQPTEPLSDLVVAALRDLADHCNLRNGFVTHPEKKWAVQYLRALRFGANEQLDPRAIEAWAGSEGGWSERHAQGLRKIVEGVNENRGFRDWDRSPIRRDPDVERAMVERWRGDIDEG